MNPAGLPVACVLTALLAAPLRAQRVASATVPAPVLHALQSRYAASGTVDWARGTDRTFVAKFARNGQTMRGVFSAAGEWLETATAIGAITLPAAVRTAVLGSYRGYQFADVWRVDRSVAPTLLFEVHLERPSDTATVRYLPGGRVVSTTVRRAPPPPPATPIVISGEWRGRGSCVTTGPDCYTDSLLYRFKPAPADSTAFDLQAFTLTQGREMPMASLPCTLDRQNAALYCSTGPGSWRFAARHDSLVGGPVAADGSLLRRVAMRRIP